MPDLENLIASVGLLRREFRDTHAVVSRLDARVTAAANPARPRSLVVRRAAAELFAHVEHTNPADVAAQKWPRDYELRTAVSPARTDTATWAAELVGTVIADVSSTLLGARVFSQLRAASAASYDMMPGHVLKVPSHQSVASGLVCRRSATDQRRLVDYQRGEFAGKKVLLAHRGFEGNFARQRRHHRGIAQSDHERGFGARHRHGFAR